jgi:iron complex outermembrane receptor protein
MSKSVIRASRGALMLALCSGPAFAQAVDDATVDEDAITSNSAPDQAEPIVVTGSRIARNGYDAPTPLTVVGTEELNQSAPANLADFVNDIPSLVGSATPATSNLSISAGTAGVNALNLRSLGSERTLVLLDGQRSVAATASGVVDVNNFPQALVKGVEIVTGGASAAYGSDAVSGVVNFILDKEFTGLKATIQGGETTYGDGRNYNLALSGGINFSGGRGHVLLSGEYAKKEGILSVPRDWNQRGWYQITNPAYVPGNGEPERLIANRVGLSNGTLGGIITNTALRGTYFGVGGAPGQFAYGTVRDRWMIGGDWETVQINSYQALEPSEDRKGIFGRLSYEITDNIEIFAQGSYNRMASLGVTSLLQSLGDVTIFSDNAFIPSSVRQRLNDLGITQFRLGTTNVDLPTRKVDTRRATERYVFGANGDFDAFGSNVRWDAYYQRGVTRTREMARDVTNNARLALAQDAVFHPVTGAIVCRSSIAAPANGCVPLNRLGIGVADTAAIAYVIGNPFRRQKFTQDVAAFNLAFDLFDLPAGAVALAVGGEHRREKISGEVDPEFRTGWAVGNFLPSFGKYNVSEAYVEALVPIADGLDFNGAIRGTDYSTSGYVTTWKGGLTYQPIPDLRFRASRSRDIRAPNLAELFQGGTTRVNAVQDPFNGNTSTPFAGTSSGNLNLDPEKADQWGVGVVVEPRFVPGLGFSVDYYDISLKGGIGSVNAQTTIDRCFDGIAEYCAAIMRGPNPFGTNLQIFETPFNFATQKAKGMDFEISYRAALDQIVPTLGGRIMLRGMATHYIKDYTDTGLGPPVEEAGQNTGSSPPSWLYRLSATFTNDPVSFTLTGRGISSGVYSNAYVECTTNCPISTSENRTINNNRIAGAFYVDANLSYDLSVAGEESQLFFNVNNLFNKDPAVVASGPDGSSPSIPATNQALYDLLGRTFRIGLRIRI